MKISSLKFFICFLLLICGLGLPASAFADNWPECRQQKLLSIKLDKAIRDGRLVSGYKSKSAMRKDLRAADKFVYKKCKRYRKKLRKLYKNSL